MEKKKAHLKKCVENIIYWITLLMHYMWAHEMTFKEDVKKSNTYLSVTVWNPTHKCDWPGEVQLYLNGGGMIFKAGGHQNQCHVSFLIEYMMAKWSHPLRMRLISPQRPKLTQFFCPILAQSWMFQKADFSTQLFFSTFSFSPLFQIKRENMESVRESTSRATRVIMMPHSRKRACRSAI